MRPSVSFNTAFKSRWPAGYKERHKGSRYLPVTVTVDLGNIGREAGIQPGLILIIIIFIYIAYFIQCEV